MDEDITIKASELAQLQIAIEEAIQELDMRDERIAILCKMLKDERAEHDELRKHMKSLGGLA